MLVARVFWVVARVFARWLLGCSGWLLGGLLGCSRWLLGCCYGGWLGCSGWLLRALLGGC